MRKITTLLLSFTLIFSLAACGSAGTSSSTGSTTAPTTGSTASADTQPEISTTTLPAEADSDTETDLSSDTGSEDTTETDPGSEDTTAPEPQSGKTLVVYYSASGNTARVAQEIATVTDADLFEIVPSAPYTGDDLNWTDSDSRVSREHDDPSLRDVPLTTTEVPDWESYDTVFIGYPIWWGIAAWPVDGFVKANDFTGKNVIPFATSSSSDIGESGILLAEMAGSGNWQEGQRFSSGASASDIRSWVDSLNL